MSYIRAKVKDQLETDEFAHGFDLGPINSEDRPDLDMNLDDEVLGFVLALITKVNDLREGEALVVWKEIF